MPSPSDPSDPSVSSGSSASTSAPEAASSSVGAAAGRPPRFRPAVLLVAAPAVLREPLPFGASAYGASSAGVSASSVPVCSSRSS